ncbi:hypothetical protein ACQ4PT_024190 [Festuca glaucescens]
MQIFVREAWVHGKGNIVALDVERSDTVDDVMAMIQDEIGVPTDKQRLFHGGKQLLEVEGRTRTMADYNIMHGSRLELLVRVGGGNCEVCGPHGTMRQDPEVVQKNIWIDVDRYEDLL